MPLIGYLVSTDRFIVDLCLSRRISNFSLPGGGLEGADLARRKFWRAGMEMLLIGAAASVITYF